MKINELNAIEQVEKRIHELQKKHVSLQEQFKTYQYNAEHDLDGSILKIIDILDMIETTKSNAVLGDEVYANAQLTIEKIEKKLSDVLKYWQTHEIILKDNQIETGKTRVLEIRKASEEEISPGTSSAVTKICRKGYQRGDKIIRPTDVIVVKR